MGQVLQEKQPTNSVDVWVAFIDYSCVDTIPEREAGLGLLVLVLVPEVRGQTLSHPVVVFAQVGHVPIVPSTTSSWHEMVDRLSWKHDLTISHNRR